MKIHLKQEVTTLCTCWRLKRGDGTIFGFTDNSFEIEYDDGEIDGLIKYKADTGGYTASSIHVTDNLAVDNHDFAGFLSDEAITENDIIAGLYSNADLHIFIVNYNDLSMGDIKLARGFLGEISLVDDLFTAEFRGLSHKLQQNIGMSTSVTCRADVGDSECGVILVVETGSITSVSSNDSFIDSARTEVDGFFNGGIVEITSGDNNGVKREIKTFTANNFQLGLPFPYPVSIDDTYHTTTGCDKTLTTCINKFSNAVNFRGEPFIPGVDESIRFGGQ